MIQLLQLFIFEYTNGNPAIGVGENSPLFGFHPIAIVGFQDWNELPKIAQFFYDRIMGIYQEQGANKLPDTDMPQPFKDFLKELNNE